MRIVRRRLQVVETTTSTLLTVRLGRYGSTCPACGAVLANHSPQELAMTTSQTKQLIVDYTNTVWNGHNVAATDRFYTSGYVHHDVSRPDVRSLADYKAWGADLMTGFPDLRVDIDDVIAEEGGQAVKRWTASGTHKGTLAGIPPTGATARFSGVSVYRFENGRIAESWYVYDLMGLLQQLGMLPAQAASA
jgi:steroid delta-isomerase-like uncharacterized protein